MENLSHPNNDFNQLAYHDSHLAQDYHEWMNPLTQGISFLFMQKLTMKYTQVCLYLNKLKLIIVMD